MWSVDRCFFYPVMFGVPRYAPREKPPKGGLPTSAIGFSTPYDPA